MPRARKSPAFMWYPRDYMADADVVAMTLEQEGAYRRLLDVCWLERGLPKETSKLWKLAKAPSRERFEKHIWPTVGCKFELRGGRYQNKRLNRERAKQAKTRRARQLAAAERWNKPQSKRDANASGLQSLALSSALASADRTDPKDQRPRGRRAPPPVENGRGRKLLKAIVWQEVEADPLQPYVELLQRVKDKAAATGIDYVALADYLHTEFEAAYSSRAEGVH